MHLVTHCSLINFFDASCVQLLQTHPKIACIILQVNNPKDNYVNYKYRVKGENNRGTIPAGIVM